MKKPPFSAVSQQTEWDMRNVKYFPLFWNVWHVIYVSNSNIKNHLWMTHWAVVHGVPYCCRFITSMSLLSVTLVFLVGWSVFVGWLKWTKVRPSLAFWKWYIEVKSDLPLRNVLAPSCGGHRVRWDPLLLFVPLTTYWQWRHNVVTEHF